MDIEALKDKLGDETFAKLKEHVDTLISQRDEARRESVDGRKKMKAELEELRRVKATLFEKLGIDDDADLDNLPEPKGQAEAVKQFEAKLKRLEREKADAEKKAQEIEAKWRASQAKAMLAEAMAGHEFADREVVESYLSARLVWEGDELFYKADDGRMVAPKDGVTAFVKAKPSLLKSAGAGGAGVKQVGAGSAGMKNPYAKETWNLTEQIALEKENPQLANQLKAAVAA